MKGGYDPLGNYDVASLIESVEHHWLLYALYTIVKKKLMFTDSPVCGVKPTEKPNYLMT